MTANTPSDAEDKGTGEETGQPKPLSEQAKRALAEAEERRRKAADADPQATQREVSGRDGPDPIRYGDWEKGGIASDF